MGGVIKENPSLVIFVFTLQLCNTGNYRGLFSNQQEWMDDYILNVLMGTTGVASYGNFTGWGIELAYAP